MDAESPADAGPDAGERADAWTPPVPDGGELPDSSVEPDGGHVMPDAGCGCDDGIACTRDVCMPGGSCAHTAEHIACPAGQYCGATGCVDGPVCATEADCPRPDPCLVVSCNSARAVCEYNLIDNDADGFPPVVCGGADCDDSTAAISPDDVETCDGVDQDCDTRIDEDNVDGEGASVSSCERGYVCDSAVCTCPSPLTECSGPGTDDHCVDLETDESSCGACGDRCWPNATCVAGECVCDPGYTVCNSACIDVTSHPNHCGSCGVRCEHECVAGTCACPAGESLCLDPFSATHCAALDSDPYDCGACHFACMTDSGCSAGVCGALTGGAVTYAARGLSTVSSPLRAGFAHLASTGASVLHIPFYGYEVRRYEGATSTLSFGTLCANCLQQHLVSVGADLSHRWATRASTGYEAALAFDAAGDVYLAGRYLNGAMIGTTSFAHPSGSMGGILAKLDGATGALLWSRTMTGSSTTVVEDVASLASGDMAAVGSTASSYDFGSGTPLPTTGGTGFVWVFAPDETYRAAWRVPGVPTLVTGDASGNVVVVARITGTVMLGGRALTGAGYVARFSPAGTVLDAFAHSDVPRAVATIGADVAFAGYSGIRRMAWDGSAIWTVPLTDVTPNDLVVDGTSVIVVGGADNGRSAMIGTRPLDTGWNIAWIARVTSTALPDRVGDFRVGSSVTNEGFASGVGAHPDGSYRMAGAYRRFVAVPGLEESSDDARRGGYFVEVTFP